MEGERKRKSLLNKRAAVGGILLILGMLVLPSRAALFSKKNSSPRGPAFLNWDPSVRAEGLGGAYVGLADDTGALFWNPAGMGQLPQSELAFGYTEEFGEQTRGDVRFVRPVWWGKERRTWGLRMAYSSVKSFDLTENGETIGTAQPREYMLGASYAQPLGPISIGGTLKGIRQDITLDAASTWAADVGVLGRVKRLQWGASVTNLGPPLRSDTGALDLPVHLRVGASLLVWGRQRAETSDKIMSLLQLDAPVDNSPRPQAGVEWTRAWQKRTAVSGRVGYRSLSGERDVMDHLTFGLGFFRNPLGINYAFLFQNDLGSTHRFELFWRFGDPIPEEQKRDELLNQAADLLKQSRMVRARSAVQEALVVSPRNHRGRQLLRQINSSIATSLDPETLLILGDQAYDEKRYEQAADYFRRLLEVNPSHPEARESLEKAEDKAGEERLRSAEARLTEERAREDRTRRSRAQTLMSEKRWSAAIVAWEKVVDLTPGDAPAQKAIARCREEARKAVGEGKVKYHRGMTAYAEGNLEVARLLFEEALTLNPGDERAEQALYRVQQEIRFRSTKP